MTFLLRRHSAALRPMSTKVCLLAFRRQRACARNSLAPAQRAPEYDATRSSRRSISISMEQEQKQHMWVAQRQRSSGVGGGQDPCDHAPYHASHHTIAPSIFLAAPPPPPSSVPRSLTSTCSACSVGSFSFSYPYPCRFVVLFLPLSLSLPPSPPASHPSP